MRGTADEVDIALVANKQALESKVFVEFGLHPKRNPLKSAEAGRDVFDDVEYIRIVVPGERDGIHRPAMQRDRENYPRQYAAFRANLSQDAASGTPLSHVLWLRPSQVAELQHYHCRTLEQLANMPDTSAQKFPGILSLRQRARDAIEVAKGEAPVAQLRADLAEEKRKREELEFRLLEMAEELKSLQKKK